MTIELREGLPSIHRAANVDRFIPAIVKLIANHPNSRIMMKLDALGLDYNTAISRCTAAMKSLIVGDTSNDTVDVATLREIRHLYKVVSNSEERAICIVPKVGDGNSSTTDVSNFLKGELRVQQPNFEQLLFAIALLFSQGFAVGEITILGILDDGIKRRIETEFNRPLIQQKFNESIML